MIKQFRLPDLGEGLTDGELLRWTVAVGDTVAVNDIIAEVETVKAAVELPSPFAGVVTELHAAEGETIPVGNPIISIDDGETGDGAAAHPTTTPVTTPSVADDLVPSLPTLVGYGPRAEGGRRRRRQPGTAAPVATRGVQTAFNLPPRGAVRPDPEVLDQPLAPIRSSGAAASGQGTRPVLAKPPVRKLAKTLGVDISAVSPTGPDGTVSREDITAAAQTSPVGTHASTGPIRERTQTRVPVVSVRRRMAEAMVASAFSAPHVTEFITADVTAMMELRDRVAARREFAGVRVAPLLFVAKAVLLAARKTPEINASWVDPVGEQPGEVVLKHYVNLGIAAATDRGLIVPNIKDADQLSLLELAEAIGRLTDLARSGKTPPADLVGGTITITNIGTFGVDTGTPILNPGETGILALGTIRRMPWVVAEPTGAGERIEPRWVTQLSVSFDHRVVDGQQGSRFLADVTGVLTDPGLSLL